MSIIEKINLLHQQLHELNSSKDAITSTQILDVFLKQFPKEGIVDAARYRELLKSESEVYCQECKSDILIKNIQRQVAELIAILEKVDNLAKQKNAFRELSKHDKSLASLTEKRDSLTKDIEQLPEIDTSKHQEEYARLSVLHDELERQERGSQVDEFPAPIYSNQSQQQQLVLDNLKRLLINKIGPHQWSLTKVELIELEEKKRQTLSLLEECGIKLETTPRVAKISELISKAQQKVQAAGGLLPSLNLALKQLSNYAVYHAYPARLEKLKQDKKSTIASLDELAKKIVAGKGDKAVSEEIDRAILNSTSITTCLQELKTSLQQQKSTHYTQRVSNFLSINSWSNWYQDHDKYNQQNAEKDKLIDNKLNYVSLLEQQQKLLEQRRLEKEEITKVKHAIDTYEESEFKLNAQELFASANSLCNRSSSLVNGKLDRLDEPDSLDKEQDRTLLTIDAINQYIEKVTHVLDTNHAIQQSLKTLNDLLVESRRIQSENNIGPEEFFAIRNSSLAESNLPNKQQIQEELDLLIQNEKALKAYQAKLAEINENKEQRQQLTEQLSKTARTLSRKKASLKKTRQQLEFPSTYSCKKAIQQSQLELNTLISQLEEIHQLPAKDKEQQPLLTPDRKQPHLKLVATNGVQKEEDSHQVLEDENEKIGSPLVEKKPEISPKNKELLVLLEEYTLENPDIEEELKQWYQALSKIAKQWLQQCDLKQQQNLTQAHQLLNLFIDLQQDISFVQEDEDFTPVLQRYQKLCPLVADGDNDFASLTPILGFKPPFLINDIIKQKEITVMKNNGNESIKLFNQTIEALRHQGISLHQHHHDNEYQLVQNAYRIINHVGTESQNGNDYSQALEGMRKDPHYQPLEKHRGAWGKFCESVAILLDNIANWLSGEPTNPSSYKSRMGFFSTKTDIAFTNALSATPPVVSQQEPSESYKKKKGQDSRPTTIEDKKEEIVAVL